MTPRAFVNALMKSVRESAESEVEYFANPPSPRPPKHLARFSRWFRQLSAADQKVACEIIRYAKEGTLFDLLTYLDNLAFLTDKFGTFELWYVSERGKRVRLNDPNGHLLTDLFNIPG